MPKSRGRSHGKKPRRRQSPPRSFDTEAIKLAGSLLVEGTTRLEAETVASHLIAAQLMMSRGMSDREPVDIAVRDLVALASKRPSASSAALVASLDLVASGPAVTEALEAWVQEHLEELPWHSERPAALLGARKVPDPYDDHVTWLLEFEDCIVAATTARWFAQAVLHIFVLERGPLDTLDDHAEPVEVDDALKAVAWGQEHTERYWPPHDEDDYRPHAQLLASRLARLDVPRDERDWEPMPEAERAALLEEFVQDLQFDDEVRDAALLLADTCLDYAEGYIHDDYLAWSPDIVEHFLMDWVPRKTLLEPEEQRLLPLVAHAFIGWSLVKRGLPRALAADCAQVALDLEEDFHSEYDESEPSPATELAAFLRDSDVDIDDKNAVDQAIGLFNAERNARLLLDRD